MESRSFGSKDLPKPRRNKLLSHMNRLLLKIPANTSGAVDSLCPSSIELFRTDSAPRKDAVATIWRIDSNFTATSGFRHHKERRCTA